LIGVYQGLHGGSWCYWAPTEQWSISKRNLLSIWFV